jgi:hypothetical protein
MRHWLRAYMLPRYDQTYPLMLGSLVLVSVASSCRYAEMWGGNVKNFPDERALLAPNGTTGWTEWIFPFQVGPFTCSSFLRLLPLLPLLMHTAARPRSALAG